MRGVSRAVGGAAIVEPGPPTDAGGRPAADPRDPKGEDRDRPRSRWPRRLPIAAPTQAVQRGWCTWRAAAEARWASRPRPTPEPQSPEASDISTGERSTRPRGASTRSTCTTTRVAEPQRVARLRADEHRLELVELPPVAAQAADRQQALEAAPKAHERAGADHARDLALELACASRDSNSSASSRKQRAIASPRRSIVIASRSRIEHHSPAASMSEARGGLLARADRRQQRAVADQVGVAADRRGEVAVARRAQAGVADVLGRVVRLLERAQHERRERRAAVAAAARPRGRRGARSRRSRRPPAAASSGSGSGGVGTSSEASWSTRRSTRAGLGPLVHAVERRQLARLQQRRRPPRWRRSSGARSAGATPSARSTRSSVTWPSRDERELGLGGLHARARRAARAPSCSAAAHAPRGGERLGPRRLRRAPRRRRSGRPAGSPAARRSG